MLIFLREIFLIGYSEIKTNTRDLEYINKQRFICFFSNSLIYISFHGSTQFQASSGAGL